MQIVFHVKRIPWFVSDVTMEDFAWVLDQLHAAGLPGAASIAQ